MIGEHHKPREASRWTHVSGCAPSQGTLLPRVSLHRFLSVSDARVPRKVEGLCSRNRCKVEVSFLVVMVTCTRVGVITVPILPL